MAKVKVEETAREFSVVLLVDDGCELWTTSIQSRAT